MKKTHATSDQQAIWICRHGNRIDFVDPSWKGDDPHLSPDGVIQAKETGIRLRGEGIQHIFASPFLRTVETAHHIADALDLSVKIEHGACEWLNAEWFASTPSLIPIDELRKRFPRVDVTYQSLVTPQYPETAEDVDSRCKRTVLLLMETYRTTDFLVVGHGASVAGMTNGLLGTESTVVPSLCALVKIRREGESLTLELDGDSSHLSSGEAHRDKFV